MECELQKKNPVNNFPNNKTRKLPPPHTHTHCLLYEEGWLNRSLHSPVEGILCIVDDTPEILECLVNEWPSGCRRHNIAVSDSKLAGACMGNEGSLEGPPTQKVVSSMGSRDISRYAEKYSFVNLPSK